MQLAAVLASEQKSLLVALTRADERAIAEGHEDEANRILEENKDVIENVKKQPGKGAIAR